jgi:hypothetical protein
MGGAGREDVPGGPIGVGVRSDRVAPRLRNLCTLMMLASARPFNSITGIDNNGDGANNDRPVIDGKAIGKSAFRGTGTQDISLFGSAAEAAARGDLAAGRGSICSITPICSAARKRLTAIRGSRIRHLASWWPSARQPTRSEPGQCRSAANGAVPGPVSVLRPRSGKIRAALV